MGAVGRLAGGVAGGVAGFAFGGPGGALVGFSLGYSVSGLIFPPDIPGSPQTDDPFQITGVTEGSPVAFVLGTRDVRGNLIFFGAVDVEEIFEEPGKGGVGGGGFVSETRPFAPVHLTLCVGSLSSLNAVYDGRRRDWQARNLEVGGSALQISSGAGTDFGYSTLATPMPGVSSVYSERLFLGENARNMPPLVFNVTVLPPSTVGDPELDIPVGVNPATIGHMVLSNAQFGRGLPSSAIDLSAFQDAFEIYRAEGRGLSPLVEGGVTSFKQILESLLFHTNSILRVGNGGALELYPLRWGNWTAIPVAEEECADVQVSLRTWGFVDNEFIATFPDRENAYTQRAIRTRNDAVIDSTGAVRSRTYDFPWITDANGANRRLYELMEEHSFPGAALAVRLSKKFHTLRPGDVIALTHSAYGFDGTPNNGYFRVLEVQDADFGKTGMQIKARQIREPLIVNYTPPHPPSEPDPPITEPQPPVGVGGEMTPWRHSHGPRLVGPPGPVPTPSPGPGPRPGSGPPGSPGYLAPVELSSGFFGYPARFWAARGSGRDVLGAFSVVHSAEASLPESVPGRTASPRWAYAFTLSEALPRRHFLRDDEPLSLDLVGYSGLTVPSFGLDDTDTNGFAKEKETGRWALLIGNTELALFEQVLRIDADTYEIYGVLRCANKEYPFEWPVGTPVMVVDTREHNIQSGQDYGDWAFRQRSIDLDDYITYDGRVRTFCQSVDLNGVLQPADEGFGGVDGQTWERRGGSIDSASGFYRPRNELLADRAPMPTCQALRIGFAADSSLRSWYAVDQGVGASLDWVIEFPPFPDDTTGIGDRVAYDEVETSGEPFGPPADPWERFHGPTDEDWSAHTGASAAVNGQTYRLIIMADISEDPLVDSPVRVYDIVFDGTETEWPAFVYSLADQSTDGTSSDGQTLVFWVVVLGRDGQPCRPRLVDKMGDSWSPQEDPTYNEVPT